MNRFTIFMVLLVSVFASLACSGGGTGSPLYPDLTPDLTNRAQAEVANSKALWGVWEVVIDTTTWEVSIIPRKGSQYTVDVVKFLQKPAGNPSNLTIKITDVSSFYSEGKLSVDVGLRHPFPGMDQFTGFDVYGVFVAPGTEMGQYDSNVTYSNGIDEPKLLNPDGYTRWMNPVEFPANGTIFRFVPGALGTKDISLFTSTINGYKYFTDGLEKGGDPTVYFADTANTDKRGYFRPGSYNLREYDLQFPLVAGSPLLVFQYAVIASWVDPDKTLSGDPGVLDVPGDFPKEANADEAILLKIASDDSTLYYDIGMGGGGDLKLGLEVFDWGLLQSSVAVPEEVYKIVVEGDSSAIPGGHVEFDQSYLQATAMPGSSVISSVFEIEITGCTPGSKAPIPLLITVESNNPDSFDPGNGTPANDDRLASYFFYDVEVGDLINVPDKIKVLNPNGGETLWMAMSREITWDPGDTVTNVKIEWSKDDFVSDIQMIASSTPNDGSYIWKPIPVVNTTTAKIRITDAVGTETDMSDGYFKIALPVWLEIQPKYVFNETSVTWGYYFPFLAARDYISPAILQTTTGVPYIGFYGINGGDGISQDCMARSTDGLSWFGSAGMFSTSGTNTGRMDNCKVAPSHNGFGWMSVSLWGNGWWTDIARGNGGSGNYCFHGPTFSYNILKYPEIATDKAGYIWYFGDRNSDGIYYVKSNQPGLTSGGGTGQVGSVTMLTDNGIISKARSWARMGQGLALIYYTTTGSIMLAKTTDAPANTTWDTTEQVWSKGTAYSTCNTPAVWEDSTGRLFAAWAARTTSGDWHVLASMRDSGGVWSTPAVVTASSTQFTEIAISSAPVLLPTGTTEDVAMVSWNRGNDLEAALSPLDMMLFLPLQQINATGDAARQSDSMCLNPALPYLYDVIFGSVTGDTPSRVAVNQADFKTP